MLLTASGVAGLEDLIDGWVHQNLVFLFSDLLMPLIHPLVDPVLEWLSDYYEYYVRDILPRHPINLSPD